MKSVGEVMAIGRTFQESLQKAIRGLEMGIYGFEPKLDLTLPDIKEVLITHIATPSPERLMYIADAFRYGLDIEEVHQYSGIDPWFLVQIADLINTELHIKHFNELDEKTLRLLKRKGFADKRLADILSVSEQVIRDKRH